MFSVQKAMFLYQKECPVSMKVRTFAAMNSIIVYISEYKTEFIIGVAIVAAFVWLYWLIWHTSKHDMP